MIEVLASPFEEVFISFCLDRLTPQVMFTIEKWFKKYIKKKEINREQKDVVYTLENKGIVFVLHTRSVVIAGISRNIFDNPMKIIKGLLVLPLYDLSKTNKIIKAKIYALLTMVAITLRGEKNKFYELPHIHKGEGRFEY